VSRKEADVIARGALSRPSLTSSWRSAYFVLAGALLLTAAIHRVTLGSLVGTWSRDPFSHAYFVVAAAVYLAWTRRERVEAVAPQPSFAALPVLGLLGIVWLAGNLTQTSLLMQLCLVPMFIVMTWAVLGSRAGRLLIFPLGLLLFAVPFGELLAPALQHLTARVAVTMLSISRLDAVLEDHIISIGAGRWFVSEACGGINYLVASLAVGYLYAGIVYRRWPHRIALMTAAALVPLAANALRVYTTILLACFGATRIVSGMEHYLYGVVVFTICLIAVFVTCGNWHEEPSVGNDAASAARRRSELLPAMVGWPTMTCAAAALLLVTSGPLFARLLDVPYTAESAIDQVAPQIALPWKAVSGNPLSWSPQFVTPHGETLQAYAAADTVVQLYVARYNAGQAGVKLVSRGNRLYGDGWWATRGQRRVIVVDGQSLQLNELMVRSSRSTLRLWNWYRIDKTLTGNDYTARLLLARARLFRTPVRAHAFVAATEERPGIDPAAVLGTFLKRASLTHPAQLAAQSSANVPPAGTPAHDQAGAVRDK
jgi:exosortase A